MPGLIMFGRRWGVATDDFVYPAASEILLRVIWLIALSTVLGIHRDSFSCENGRLLATYYATMIGVLSVTVVLDVIIVRVSSRGSIVDNRPRRLVVPLLYVKVCIYFFEIIWNALGTYWAFSPSSSQCPWDVLVLARGATIVGWFLLFALLIAVVVVFDPIGGYYHRRHRRQHIHGDSIPGDRGKLSDEGADMRLRERDDLRRLWKLRCRLLCCGCCQCFDTEGDTSSAFEDIAQLLTSYFTGVDFVATDVAAGLILVQQQQTRETSCMSHVQFQSIHNAVQQILDEQAAAAGVHGVSLSHAIATDMMLTQAVVAAKRLTTDIEHSADSAVLNGAAADSAESVSAATRAAASATVSAAVGAADATVDAAVDAAVDAIVPTTASVVGAAATDDLPSNATATVAGAASAATVAASVAGEMLYELNAMITQYMLSAHWMTLSNAAHYMKYALASYGWAFYVYDNRLTGPCRLCLNSKWCFCLRGDSADVRGDNCIACNTAALLLQTNISRDDIIYVRFVNRVYETPFYVAYDHEKRSIVVSIRGTLSLSDALTDLSAEVDAMEVPGVEDARAHRGILKAALQTKNTLQRKQLLETALSQHPDYDIVVTGHSLGAGTAAVLAILLKDEYPNLKCFSYSPPGWLVSLSLSRYARDFVCSVVLGNDLVPRMGLVTFDKLKNQMLQLVHQSTTPKYHILASGFWQALCSSGSADDSTRQQCDNVEVTTSHYNPEAGWPVRGPDERQPLLITSRSQQHEQPGGGARYTEESGSHSADHRSNGQVNERAGEQTDITNDMLEERDGQTYTMPEFITCPLYMPGQVLYIHSLNAYSSYTEPMLYRAGWTLPESFDEIIVDSSMLTDHMPHNVYKALRAAAADSRNADCPTVVLQRPRHHTPTTEQQQQLGEIA